ncbi:hypothetical secreted protein [Ligilactobacillus salitolerans]|uniref:Hypothetical secreted protein n=1 Tax=Ligilactobacillus salitolerans TaxID=1808352 RepID=A0A401IVA9_9LACO|nr:LysM peptidoglycan-binding domain-containing protein [Ligilactobacillus salitolerans]GBG95474.1 hypothetical secreted protein [Ligilactobacillus salitolerans]
MNHSTKSLLVGTVGAAGLFLAGTASVSANTSHKVVSNDTVWALSQKYGVSVQSIEQLNHISTSSHLIYPGQSVQIPDKDAKAAPVKATASSSTYTVKSGDTLWSIAQARKTSVQKLLALNGLKSNVLQPGQSLKVAGTVAVQAAQPQKAQAQKAAAPQVSVNHTTYKVQTGDSLYTVAQKFGVTVASLRAANSLNGALTVGQTLTVNDPAKTPAAQTSTASQNQTQTASSSQSQAQTQQSSAQTASKATTTYRPQAQTRAAVSSASSTSAQTAKTAVSTSTQSSNNTSSTTSTNANGSAIVSYAMQFVGANYVYGATGPSQFDCSGFTYYVFKHFGKTLPRTSQAQESAGTQVSLSQAQPGDLIIGNNGGHVGIYVGNGKMISAENPSTGVRVNSISYFNPMYAVRVN